MTQSTFLYQVANKLLMLLQGYSKTIRLLLVMFLTLTASTAWGAALTGNYTKITNISNLSAGDRVVLYADDISKGVTGWDGNKDATVSESGWVEYLVESASGGVYLKDENAGKYIASPGSSNQFKYGTKAVCTVNENGVLKCNSRFLVQNGTYYRMYSSIGSYKPFYVYKVSAATPSYDITVKSNNDAYGSVSISGKTITATPNAGYRVKSGDAGYTVTSGTAVVTNNGDNTFSVTPSSVCTITINFEAIPKYTVTWNVNGDVYETTQVTEGSKPTFPATPSSCDVTSNTFYGWATATWDGKINDVSANTIYTSANNMPAEAATYHAVFCDGGGGSVLINEPFDNSSTSDASQAFSSSTFPNFSGETGKAYKSKYGGVKFGTSSAVGYITSKSLDLSTAFTVTLDACKYGSDAGNIEVTVGTQTKTISNSSLGAAGTFKTFTLEFDAATSTSTVKIATSQKRAYIDNVIIATGGGASNFITTCAAGDPCASLQAPNVTATATANSITLSWDAVDGATSYNVYNYTTEEAEEVNVLTYTFNGLDPETEYEWGVESAKDECFKETRGTTTTLAEAPNTYTITFEANGGTKIDKITDATALPDPLPTTTRDHYTFTGWFTDEDCTQAATAGATINANTTLYAKWTPVTYTVTFDAGSGIYTSGDIQGNFETGLTLPTATPCDYASTNSWSFVGWSESSVSETTVRPAIHTGNYKPTKNITLYAVYAKTGTAQGGAGEFVLSLQYEGTTYYVGQTFDNSKLSAETEQTNAARFTIEDNYLHYEGGYISHVATTSSPNITKQADKANAQEWTITAEANTIIFTSTADNTRGLGFNYNNGSPRFAAYQLSNDDYPHTFTKTSVSGGNVQVTTYNSKPSCEAPVDPNWVAATITHTAIKANCGSTTVLGSEGENGPATISFGGTDLQNSVTVTASNGFLVSTDKTAPEKYAQSVIIYPNSTGNNIGKITQGVHVIANAPAQSGDYTGTITLTGNDIPGGSQVINVTAAVTCTQYTITWSVSGDTEMIEPTTFYAGGEWTLPEDPTFDCNGRVFVGWTNNEIVQPQDIAPNVLYKEQGDFPTIESDITFYAVFAQEGTGDGSGTATVTDVLNRETTGATNTTYIAWSDKQATSSAVYAGNSAGGNNSIQLRSDASKDAAGIITTTSGGKATKVIVAWHNQTAADRTLNVYGKNSAYSAVADLRGENTRGTLLGTIVNGTSTSLTINDDYEYIGLCSKSGAMYLTSISITWATDGEGDGNATTYTSYTTSCADVKAIRIVEPTTKTFNEGDKFVFDGEVWAINSDDTETNVTNSPLVHFVYDMNKVGTQTVTVSYLGFTATYEITINAVEKWQITWNVSGATNTGLGPKEVAKGTAIGKLPQPKEIPAGCTGKEFRGWTESNTVNSDGSNIEWITEETVPTANTTYYAVFATNSGEDSGDGNYVKLTDTPADLSGEYLIVYEDAENNYDGAKAFDGGLTTLDAASNTIDVTIIGNTIASTDDTDAAEFTIAPYNGGYSIKSASGYFIGQTSYDNDLASHTTTQYINNIAIESSNAIISCSTNGGDVTLKYNKTSGQTRFRYYKTGQQPIALYKQSSSSASYTDYTTGCHDVTITYYGFTGGYTTNCGGSDLNVITQRVNSSHTIPTCTEITDPTDLGRTFLNLWKDQNGKEHKPGDSFIVTQDITLYAQWRLETTNDVELRTDVVDLATTDVVVTGGTTLTLQAGTTTINSLTLKGGRTDDDYLMPAIYSDDEASVELTETTIPFYLSVDMANYYPFAVPFPVAVNQVNYADPTLANASEYGTHYVIKRYDGANRANQGENKNANWVKVEDTETLQPGIGYIITAVPIGGEALIRFPMTPEQLWSSEGKTVDVAAYTGAAAQQHPRHAGWNFVANPYLSRFAGVNVGNEKNLLNGVLNYVNGEWQKTGEVPYVTIPASDFSYYEQVELDNAILSPSYAFFVQAAQTATLSFATAGRQQNMPALCAAAVEPLRLPLMLTQATANDRTTLLVSDDYTANYEIGKDLEKMFGSTEQVSLYAWSSNTPLAYCAVPWASAIQAIPLGYRARQAGSVTIALDASADMSDAEMVLLYDAVTGMTTNLLINSYTFETEVGTHDARFTVMITPKQGATTGCEEVMLPTEGTYKFLRNGQL